MNIRATQTRNNGDGTFSIFFDQNYLPAIGKTYTLTIRAGGMDPANSKDITLEFTATCEGVYV